MPKIRVLLADDHAVLRAGLRTLLNAQPDIEVIAEAADGEKALLLTESLSPDVVLMDIAMPGLDGLVTTQRIKKRDPGVKVLVLTMHEEKSYLLQMLRAGADGYVPKKAADTELIDAIRATHRGEHFIHSSMTAEFLAGIRDPEPARAVAEDARLSFREVEVLRLIAMGHTNQEIADALFLSIKTVETYKARLKEKLGVKGRAELVRYAMEQGLLAPGGDASHD